MVGENRVKRRSRRSAKKSASQPGVTPTAANSEAQAVAMPEAEVASQSGAHLVAQRTTEPVAETATQLNAQTDTDPRPQPSSQPGVQADVHPCVQHEVKPGVQPGGLLSGESDADTTITHGTATAGLARPIDHWCRLPHEYADIPSATWKNTSIPLEADGKTRSECLRYEPLHSVSDGHDIENRTVIPCDAGWEYDKADKTGIGAYSIVSEWDLVCERRWILTLLMASYVFGGILGAATAGVTADNIGRRPVLRIWLFFLVVSGIALIFSKTLMMFAILRAVLAAAVSSVLVTSIVILFEVTSTPHRALFMSLAVAGASLIAAFYGELVYYLAPAWQIEQLAYMAPTSVLIMAVYLMDESPCWLLAVSNMRRADSVLAWAAQVNKVQPDVFKNRLVELKMELKRQQEQPEPGALDILSQEHGIRVTDVLRSGTLRYRSAILFGCSFVSFAMYFNLSTGEVMRTNPMARTVLAVLKLPGMMINVPVITHAGRRMSLAFSMIVMSAIALMLSGAHVFHAPEVLLATVTVSSLLAFDLCAITLFIMSAELYPTVVRGAGVGLCYTFSLVGSAVAPLVDEIKSDGLKGAVYAVEAMFLLFFGAMAMLLPETTKLLPANTIRELSTNKWQLQTPLRVARFSKRKRPKSEDHDRSKIRSRPANAPAKEAQ
ncbi:hypothetical protein HPB52_010919 [Rhipicephalus sanguineus]|uniref:Major facilitator superfamily (MFS) profile domain-containing protein n=1 Tax=Rhipicephalus sanguineus TaxID=34632 RepID=A0A9D4PSJ3_RHISA|nr:hypothetical protein HPB52_010919 [Rhipicephalus sanguineus]